MGWIIGIIAAVWVAAWLYSRMRPNDMESVIRGLPEAERRQLCRDFEKIERDEPTEGDPEYGQPGTPWGMFDGEGADGRLRAHWTHSSERNARRQVKVGGEYLCRVGDDRDWRQVWFRVLDIEAVRETISDGGDSAPLSSKWIERGERGRVAAGEARFSLIEGALV